jgi:phospholipid/cholesterol/gamma-HCH transport system substrate-binding protein
MNERSNKRAVIVGIFIFLGIGFLLAGILTIGNLRNTFSTKISLVAFFDDVNGLQKGNNVWFSGVKIGTVKTVKFYGQSHVKVIMNVDENSRQFIRKDSHLKISTDGLIGHKIIVIYGGSFLSGAVLEGDTLPVDKMLSTEEMVNMLQENNKNLLDITNDIRKISGKLAKGSGNIGKFIEDENIYNNLSATMVALRQSSTKLNEMMASVSSFASGLTRKGTLAHGLSNDTTVYANLKRSLKKMSTAADSAAQFVNNLNNAVNREKGPAGVLLHDEEAGKDLKTTLNNLASGSKKLDEDLEAAQHSFLLRRFFKKKEKEQKK